MLLNLGGNLIPHFNQISRKLIFEIKIQKQISKILGSSLLN